MGDGALSAVRPLSHARLAAVLAAPMPILPALIAAVQLLPMPAATRAW